jgi:hypothetical protein
MKFQLHPLAVSIFLAGTSFLSKLPAQAAWTGPVYKITDQISYPPAPPGTTTTTTTAPSRGGGISSVNHPCGGTVTATFTWGVNDGPVPTDVYVLQYGKANVNQSGGTQARTQPAPEELGSTSIQDAIYSPRQHPRLRLIQTQGGGGNVTNGLGDTPQTVPTGGNSSNITSEGYEVTLCHPGGSRTFTTPAVTLYAAGTSGPGAGYMPSWTYNAGVMGLSITRNNVDITSPDHPEIPVMVGEKNTVAVSISPIPTGNGIAPPTYKWTIEGSRIKNYVQTSGTQANPPAAATPYSASEVELPAEDLTKQTLDFYWYNGSFAGDSNEVKCVITLDGEQPITLKGKCKVYRPRLDSYTGTYTSRNPPIDVSTYETSIDGQPVMIDFLGLGTKATAGIRGITFSAQVDNPLIPSADGEIAFLQLISANSETNITGTAPSTVQTTDALDSARTTPEFHGTDDIAAGATNQVINRDDTPGAIGNNLDSKGDFYKQDSRFKTHLLYRPRTANSIWVPLGLLEWRVSFKVVLNDPDVPPFVFSNLFPTTQPNGDPPAIIAGTDSTTFPKYTERIQDK